MIEELADYTFIDARPASMRELYSRKPKDFIPIGPRRQHFFMVPRTSGLPMRSFFAPNIGESPTGSR